MTPQFIACLLLLLPFCASADFETWTNRDGKAVEMKVLSVDEEKGAVEFETRSGKRAIMQISKLRDEDQARLKNWMPTVEPKFIEVKRETRRTPKGVFPALVFDYTVDSPNLIDAQKVSVKKCMIGGNAVEFPHWTTSGYSDPFLKEADKGQYEFSVNGIGEFADAPLGDSELEAEVTFRFGFKPKKVHSFFSIPKTDDPEWQQMGPLRVRLVPSRWSVDADAPDDAVGELSGYYIQTNGEDFNTHLVAEQVIVSNGKEYKNEVEVGQAAQKMKVVLTYWSEVREVPVKVVKMPGQKGVPRPVKPDPFAR